LQVAYPKISGKTHLKVVYWFLLLLFVNLLKLAYNYNR
jgi:hypothetical protein